MTLVHIDMYTSLSPTRSPTRSLSPTMPSPPPPPPPPPSPALPKVIKKRRPKRPPLLNQADPLVKWDCQQYLQGALYQAYLKMSDDAAARGRLCRS